MSKMPHNVRKKLANELIKEIKNQHIDIRVKPNYKEKHQRIVNLANIMFWSARNWYEVIPFLTLSIILLVNYFLSIVPFLTGGIIGVGISLTMLITFELFRHLSVGVFDRTFDDFYTNIDETVYVPSVYLDYIEKLGWETLVKDNDSFHKTIRHELLHHYQKQELGKDAFIFGYIFPPIFLTFRGGKFEIEAYAQNMLMDYHFSEYDEVSEEKRKWVTSQFVSPSYLFMFVPIPLPFIWSKPARWMVDKYADKIENEEITGMWPYHPNKLVPEYD